MKIINSTALILFAGIFILGCHRAQPVIKADNAIPVKVIPGIALQDAEPLETSGLLSSEQQSNLSFKTGGIISRILVKEGDHVHKGQVLATLNMTEINAQLSQARENYNKAKRDAQRTGNLFRDSVATREQYEHMQTALTIAKKQLDITQYNTGQSTITASTDGVALKKFANEGEQVAGGSPILFISSIAGKDWVIKCGLTDKDRARISGNEKAEITFDAYPQTFTGRVKTLAQGSDSGSGLYQAEIHLDPADVKLVAGLFAKVSIYPSGKTDLLAVPMDALLEGKNDSAYVFVASDHQSPVRNAPGRRAAGQQSATQQETELRALLKLVKVAYLKGDKAYLSSGITTSDRVIREGSAYLNQGSVIKIIK